MGGMKLERILRETAARMARFPWWCAVVVAVLCLVLGEWFPFSNFPMYSRNPDETSVLFVTGEDGAVVPTGHVFGVTSSPLKKVYTRVVADMKAAGELRHSSELTAAQRQAIAEEVLVFLRRGKANGVVRPVYEGKLRLHRRSYRLEGGEIRESTELLGEG